MTTLYGISNCDTVHKARKWLDTHQINYKFHDFRKAGLTLETVQQWLSQVPLEKLVNKRSASWRQLSEEEKRDLLENQNLEILLQNPTLIKRPVLVTNKTLLIGFKETDYDETFANKNG